MSTSYQPKPTTAANTGVQNIVPHYERRAAVEDVRGSFENAFGGYVPPEWTFDAECTWPGVDPQVFHPKTKNAESTAKALTYCSACAVRDVCLADALAFESGEIGSDDVRPEVHGIRGGKTEEERRTMVAEIRATRRTELRRMIVAEYAAGAAVDELAEKYGVSTSSVPTWAKEAGVEIRPRGITRRNVEVGKAREARGGKPPRPSRVAKARRTGA